MDNIKFSIKLNKLLSGFGKFIWVGLVLALVVSLFSGNVYAAWDGSGSTGGTSGSYAEVTGNYWLNDIGIGDAMGYRFSIYDGSGG